ncbi:MAG: fluoride efflux transporter CrcB [Burkholderiales bacterium]|nr:fluoride efflux transporter CrcB [Burkholderiales bacterium]
MGALSFLAVGVGATLGAWLRWALSVGLNNYVINLPLGTLVANLGGGYLIGIAVGFFQDFPELFLGGLTTFSTFSAEAMLLLQRSEYVWAITHTGLHLLGSIAFCIAGLATWRMIAG